MNSKQRKTLAAVFLYPVSTTIPWKDIESLLMALGCYRKEGQGSAVQFSLNQVVGRFHRPHPGKEAKPYQVRDARAFLIKAGVKP